MKKALLFLLLPFLNIQAQNTLELKIKSSDFREVARAEFHSDVYTWTKGAYDFLGPSAYSISPQILDLEIRFKVEGHWQEWQYMNDQHDAEGIKDRQTWVLDLLEYPIEAWQLRIQKIKPADITMRFYWSPIAGENTKKHLPQKETKPSSLNSNTPSNFQSCTCPPPPICGRNCWCPNNNCPPPSSYTPTTPTHLIVHHSAGANSSNDFAAVVAYYWDLHVNTNGWDDIGYNWLIDPNGVVYEGRGSGNTGAHFSCLNSETLGFCLIGNYENSPVPGAGLQALNDILLYEACQNNIDPADSSIHQSSQLNLRHISGHRDANSATVGCPKGTACPGQIMYNKLDSLGLALSQEICLLHQSETPLPSNYFYPNPTSSQLHWDIQLRALKLFDAQGREIHLPMSEEKTLDLSDLAPGIYSLHFRQEEQWQQQKIYIQ